ncbi:MAG: hypothetical protein E6F99_17370 [Actinobacteria bacterium]|nr:MAG: hypothetical protein E6F99_17370 [Actinomycetota bacterium]
MELAVRLTNRHRVLTGVGMDDGMRGISALVLSAVLLLTPGAAGAAPADWSGLRSTRAAP